MENTTEEQKLLAAICDALGLDDDVGQMIASKTARQSVLNTIAQLSEAARGAATFIEATLPDDAAFGLVAKRLRSALAPFSKQEDK